MASEALAEPRPIAEPCRVLLAEDSAVQRLATASMLRQAGYDVIEAQDGAEAAEQLTAHESLPDVVLSDIGMPKMNGLALCRHIKSTPALQHLPVVILTALSSDRNHVAALDAGADDFIVKPPTEDDLVLRLNVVVARARLRAPGATEWHKAVFDALPEAVVVTDAEHRYVEANAAALELLGYSRSQLLNLSVTDDGSPPPWADAEELGTSGWHGRTRARRGDGGDLALEVHVSRANFGGEMFYVIVLHGLRTITSG